MPRQLSKEIDMVQGITEKPLFKDAAFVFGLLLVIAAWKVVIEQE